MDLYVERQYVEQMKNGDTAKFLALFDEAFREVYLYVFRRVEDRVAAEEIVRMTFLEALSQVANVPADTSFVVWLYSLARPRVWRYLEKNGFPTSQGEAGKIFSKLLLEEREIVRLKFFEEVSDGDIMTVLGSQDEAIGTKIYRVLKRVHFLVFGEKEESQAVYFGELSGFLARLREEENIEVPEAQKLSLRADLAARIDRRDFAMEVEAISEEKVDYSGATGSDDPAKIFVEAVREMREEEDKERNKEIKKEGNVGEEMFIMEEDSAVLVLLKKLALVVPALLFVAVVWVLVLKFVFDGKVERGFAQVCGDEVVVEGNFTDQVKRGIYQEVADPICEHFEEKAVRIGLDEEGRLKVEVDLSAAMLKYDFVRYEDRWKIKKYERIVGSNEERGEA